MKYNYIAAATAALILAGCGGRSVDMMEHESLKLKKNERLLQEEQAQMKSPLYTLMQKKVHAKFRNATVYGAVRNVARQLRLKVDTSFIPSYDYRVTMNNKTMTLGEFLDGVYRQSGVEYKYRDGLLKVFNKKLVEPHIRVKECTGTPSIKVALKNVPPMMVFKHFSTKYGYSFDFDTKFTDLSPASAPNTTQRNTATYSPQNDSGLTPARPVSFFYKGCDSKEALLKFAKSADLKITFSGDKKATVKDYETAILEIPSYFDTEFESTGTSVGGGSQSGGQNGGGSNGGNNGAEGATLKYEEAFKREFAEYIKTHLSPTGTVYVSSRGYVTVTDKPSYVREVRRLVHKEAKAQSPIELDVSVIRIDVKDEYASGIDWNFALREIGNELGIRNLKIGLNYSSMVEGGLNLGGVYNGEQQLLKLLGKYGNAKIARDYNTKTRSGMLNTFRAVQEIPYVTTSVVQNANTSEVGMEAKVAVAGLIINIIPTLARDNELVNLSTDITISEYLGDKTFSVSGNTISLPQIATNKVQMAAVVHLGETMILTGFKLREGEKNDEGVPGAVRHDIVGTLFGSKEQTSKVAEFIVVVTPKKIRSF